MLKILEKNKITSLFIVKLYSVVVNSNIASLCQLYYIHFTLRNTYTMDIYLKILAQVIDRGQIAINHKIYYTDEKFTTVKI